MPDTVAAPWTCPTCRRRIDTAYCPSCGERPRSPSDLTLGGLAAQDLETDVGIGHSTFVIQAASFGGL